MTPETAPSRGPISRSDPASASATRFDALLLWIGLGVALSPALLDLVRHWIATPWSRYSLVFVLLFSVCARDQRLPRARWAGWIWIGAGLALEVFAAFAGAIRWARASLAMAVVGMCERNGIAAWRTRVLLLFAVPAPAQLVRAGSGIGSHLVRVVADLARGAGLTVSAVGRELQVAGASISLPREWLTLALLLAGLAWYEGIRSRRPLRRTIPLAAGAAVLAVPIQMLALALAVGLAAVGAPHAAQVWIEHGLWLAVATAGIAWIELHARRLASHRP